MKRALLILTLTLTYTHLSVFGQQVGIKSNALYWATTTPNLGVEVATGRHTSVQITGGLNPWTFGSKDSNKKIQHWLVRPEVRYWVCEKFDGSFFGVHGFFSSYNAGGINIPILPFNHMKYYRYDGYAAGGGISYGYQWFLGPHWNLEISAGLGYVYFNYKQYECQRCGDFVQKTNKHWFGPTNIGASFIYFIKSNPY